MKTSCIIKIFLNLWSSCKSRNMKELATVNGIANARKASDFNGAIVRIRTKRKIPINIPEVKYAFRRKAAVSSNLRDFGSWIYLWSLLV